MTTITHTADGPRFDGMTVGELIASLDREATILEAANEEGVPYIRSIIAALRHLSEWQPIETAPRDGTHILCFHPKYDMILNGVWDGGHINDFEMKDERLEYVKDFRPTHWRPLPPGPDGGGA